MANLCNHISTNGYYYFLVQKQNISIWSIQHTNKLESSSQRDSIILQSNLWPCYAYKEISDLLYFFSYFCSWMTLCKPSYNQVPMNKLKIVCFMNQNWRKLCLLFCLVLHAWIDPIEKFERDNPLSYLLLRQQRMKWKGFIQQC